MYSHTVWITGALLLAIFCFRSLSLGAESDLILHHGRIVTVDAKFSIQQAIAVEGNRIVAVGSDEDILKTRGAKTTVVDLGGKMVLPGLIDSHMHPTEAAMIEFDHPIPDMQLVGDVLDYVKARAAALGEGKWIAVRQVFITRLREQRYPTRAELDAAAPKNPVLFATGPDASVNTLALKLSGIDRDFKVSDGGAGYIEKDPATGEPTGILRNCTRFVKCKETDRPASKADYERRLIELFKDYNSVGLTSISDRSSEPEEFARFATLRDANQLTVRISACQYINASSPVETVLEKVRAVAKHPLRKDDEMLRIVGTKVYLDGGMLTGSAYMLKPWGVSTIYGIGDPDYRGLLFIPKEKLVQIVRAVVEEGMQFNAHCVGDGAVETLLGAYEEVNKSLPVRPTRPCLAHANFQGPDTAQRLAKIGAVVDMQPAWLYLDTRTLVKQFGYDRLRYFQPYKTLFDAGAIAAGGSDHMQKVGSMRSINPYNPFLAMWTVITRQARWYEGQLHPEEAISREQAIRLYTTNSAFVLFREKQVGSLETGKLADMVVLDRDLLTCDVDQIKDAQVLATYLGGKRVFGRE